MLRVSGVVAAGLRRACSSLTYFGFITHRHGLHPHAGHGLPAGQRAAARLGLDGAHRSGHAARSRRSPASTPGVKHATAIAGQSFALERQRLELRLDVRQPDYGPVSTNRPQTRKLVAQRRRSPTICAREFDAEIPDAQRRRLRPAAGARRRPGRRLHVHDRGPRRPRPVELQKQADVWHSQHLTAVNRHPRYAPEQLAETCRLANEHPNRRSARCGLFTVFRANVPQLADRRPTRARCMATRRSARGRRRHAAGLPRLAVRQRLQPVRPHLAGDRPGRRAVPRPGRRTSRS